MSNNVPKCKCGHPIAAHGPVNTEGASPCSVQKCKCDDIYEIVPSEVEIRQDRNAGVQWEVNVRNDESKQLTALISKWKSESKSENDILAEISLRILDFKKIEEEMRLRQLTARLTKQDREKEFLEKLTVEERQHFARTRPTRPESDKKAERRLTRIERAIEGMVENLMQANPNLTRKVALERAKKLMGD